MLKYDEDKIQELCSKVDLLDYASKTVDFRRRGKNYVAHCPKHIDKTPSLTISPNNNFFHCFSCKKGGNILQWLMYYEKLKFSQALRKVSNMVGENLDNYKISETLAFYKQLKKIVVEEEPKITRQVLDEKVLKKYELVAPQTWVDEGISPDIMRKYNIRIDHRANRVVYPVYDKHFNLIGIKGRTLYENYSDLGLQKYQNYHKIGTTNFFVGLKDTIEEVTRKNEVIIFEGIKSGMKAEMWGYGNWVATETSYINDEQIRILIKLGIKDVVIAFDNDVSLEQIRGHTRLLCRFMNVYCVLDRNKVLGEKSEKFSPVDKGKEIWKQLYKERVRLN